MLKSASDFLGGELLWSGFGRRKNWIEFVYIDS